MITFSIILLLLLCSWLNKCWRSEHESKMNLLLTPNLWMLYNKHSFQPVCENKLAWVVQCVRNRDGCTLGERLSHTQSRQLGCLFPAHHCKTHQSVRIQTLTRVLSLNCQFSVSHNHILVFAESGSVSDFLFSWAFWDWDLLFNGYLGRAVYTVLHIQAY